ncbi:agmatine deiminase family protein [Pendulispora albinea]|uniref:Agmatine deiminase family protein n=1 Tax=Pendulispora albinea TaxID=2741071 RepID=A0ABZ2LW77_9BACT
MPRRQFRIVVPVALTVLLMGAGCASNADEQTGAEDTNVSDVTRNALVDHEGSARSTGLPNWATEEELAVQRNARAPQERAEAAPEAAPAPGYRVPAEYEPVSTVVMTYAAHTAVLRGIAVAAAAADANVWMVGGPSSISGVPANRYRALSYGYDSIWSRDYGPVGINEVTRKLGIIDTTYRHYATRRNDDAMSCKLASALSAECHTTNLILDGGNYMTDGRGNAFLSKRVYDWNSSLSKATVDGLLKSYLGATTIHILDYAASSGGSPADGTGHIDMFAKLVGDCKVIVAQATTEPFRSVTDKAAAYFANLSCGTGRYTVTRVKGWQSGGTWYTYTNSLIVNNTAIIPFYNNTAENDAATRAYKAALPGYTVVGVNSEGPIVQGGSIHCITKEIPTVAAAL